MCTLYFFNFLPLPFRLLQFVSRVFAWLNSNSWTGAFFYGSLPSALLAELLASDVASRVSTYLSCLVIFGAILKSIPNRQSFRLRIVPTTEVSTFSAVKGVSYAIEDKSCFVLLGHNGAGKVDGSERERERDDQEEARVE